MTSVPSSVPSSLPWSVDVALTAQEAWEWALGAPLRIVVVVIAAIVTRWLLHRAISRVVRLATERSDERRRSLRGRAGTVLAVAAGLGHERRKQRARTMGSLLRSIATFAVAAITVLTIMAEVGLPLGPLLASAGVGGVALGFGAQSLVQDFLSGIFMIVEDQYGVGDVIDTGEVMGTVEEVTLRVTRVRDFGGVVWFLRNGDIRKIGNRSQGWAIEAIDIPVAYDEDPGVVAPIIADVASRMYAEAPWNTLLLEEPSFSGVQSVSGGVMNLRVFATCQPNEQWGVTRELRQRLKHAFDEAGVRGPQLPPYGSPAEG